MHNLEKNERNIVLRNILSLSIPLSILLFLSVTTTSTCIYGNGFNSTEVGFPFLWCGITEKKMLFSNYKISILPLITNLLLYMLIVTYVINFIVHKFSKGKALIYITGAVVGLILMSNFFPIFGGLISRILILLFIIGIITRKLILIKITFWLSFVLFLLLEVNFLKPDITFSLWASHYPGKELKKVEWNGFVLGTPSSLCK